MPDTISPLTGQRTAVRTDMPLYLQASLRDLFKGDWRAVEEALRTDSDSEKALKNLITAHETVSATWIAVGDAHKGFMARADESPSRNARDSRAAAERTINAALPSIQSAVRRARGRWHELGARIDRALTEAAEKWPFGAEARSRVLHAASDTGRLELVRSFILSGDQQSAGSVIGAPRSVTGVTAQHLELLRGEWEQAFFGDEGHMRAVLQSGADQVEKDVEALKRHLDHLTDVKRIEAEVARVAAAAEIAEAASRKRRWA